MFILIRDKVFSTSDFNEHPIQQLQSYGSMHSFNPRHVDFHVKCCEFIKPTTSRCSFDNERPIDFLALRS